MTQTALILGATGRFGRNAAERFSAAGWSVRKFDRKHDDLLSAATGADVIVNGWNPTYPDWEVQYPDLTARVIDVARKTDATIILPGNVYVFGADAPPPWSDATPHLATNPLGLVRIRMEDAYRNSGVRTILLRAGDFIDTQDSGNWFDEVITKSLTKGRFTYPGNPDIPHSWAYLPDFCRAIVQLANRREELPVYTDLAFPGYTMSGREMAAALDQLTPYPVRLRTMWWLPITLAHPFWRMAGCLLEMRYLWNTPHWLDRRAFDKVLPGFGSTPVHEALANAISVPSLQRDIHPDQPVTAGS